MRNLLMEDVMATTTTLKCWKNATNIAIPMVCLPIHSSNYAAEEPSNYTTLYTHIALQVVLQCALKTTATM